MKRDIWLRFKHSTDENLRQRGEILSLLVPIQQVHMVEFGKSSQVELTGPGEIDMKLEFDEPNTEIWDFRKALEYCVSELQNFNCGRGKDKEEALSSLIVSRIGNLKGVKLGQPTIAPNKQLSQEYLIPADVLKRLIQRSKSKVADFHILREIGFQCFATQNLDRQPAIFRNWYTDMLRGRIVSPGRQPQAWTKIIRDQLIAAIVEGLKGHGIRPMRNETSIHQSGCDAVAKAAILVGINNPRSYETVRKIYTRYKA